MIHEYTEREKIKFIMETDREVLIKSSDHFCWQPSGGVNEIYDRFSKQG